MISYNSSGVIQCLRQYEMFANSLNLVKSFDERDMIIKQLTKLEHKIFDLTNDIYEEEYYNLADKECDLLDDEKKRITALINLIDQRLSYVEKRCNDYYQLTGKTLDVSDDDIVGASTLDNLEDRVKIIDKYSKNVKLYSELSEDVKSLTSKIELASEKIEINKNLNVELEAKFKSVLSDAFEKTNLYDLLDEREALEYAYYETEKSLTLAELNLESAKTSPINIVADCQKMLDEVREDYVKYKDRISILKLMELFNKEVDNYDELLNKRNEVNDLFKSIKNEKLISMVADLIDKQYNTILMEKQDVNTYNDLLSEKEHKLEAMSEIETENNSEKFQSVLKKMIANEKKKQERILEEQRKLDEEEKKRKIEIERKRQEEILKRQKIIEEARKKEIEKRTKMMLEQQQNSILQSKSKDKKMSFSTIKDISNHDDTLEQEKMLSRVERIKEVEEKNENDDFDDTSKEVQDTLLFKDKNDIENELFEEFNNIKTNFDDDRKTSVDQDINDDNKFPDMSIDEYMKKFNEKEINLDESNLFSDDLFPTIPM